MSETISPIPGIDPTVDGVLPMDTRRLAGVLVNLVPKFTGKTPYGYQRRVQSAIIRDVLENHGDTITIQFPRQSGKSEAIAGVCVVLLIFMPILAELFPNDSRFVLCDHESGAVVGYKEGIKIGCFGPKKEQADIIFSRVKDFLNRPDTKVVLEALELESTSANGKIVRLSSGSYMRANTASKDASIEGDSYHLIITDETQDIDEQKIMKSIRPMGASTNATVVHVGTAGIGKVLFYKEIKRNMRLFASGARKCHFEIHWEEAAKENVFYKKYVNRDRDKYGEDSDEFRMNYCLAPGTRVLLSDMRYARVEDLLPGDVLAGFDENVPGSGRSRRFRSAQVISRQTITRPCYDVTLSDGTEVRCSSEHRWLVYEGSLTKWVRTDELCTDHRIVKAVGRWEPVKETYEVGYLRAAYDKGGRVVYGPRGLSQVSLSQKSDAIIAEVKRCLDTVGFAYNEYALSGGIRVLNIAGGRDEALRFIAEIRPQRLANKLSWDRVGLITRRGGLQHPEVYAVSPCGDQKVISVRTTTGTFIAEGLASHNCNVWMLERGQYVTEKALRKLFEERETGELWHTPVYLNNPKGRNLALVVGMDFAKRRDKTVMTVGVVDYDKPLLEEEVMDDQGWRILTEFKVDLVSWYSWQGDDYEKQFNDIAVILAQLQNNLPVKRVACDVNGCGAPIFDRFQARYPDIEWVAVPYQPKDKDLIYRNLLRMIRRGQVGIPAAEETMQSRDWMVWFQEMCDLEKDYSNGLIVVHHPKEDGAHDDYPDSMALMCWAGTHRPNLSEIEVSDGNSFYL